MPLLCTAVHHNSHNDIATYTNSEKHRAICLLYHLGIPLPALITKPLNMVFERQSVIG